MGTIAPQTTVTKMTDTIPPSYQTATTRDAWSIIPQYIPSSDLCAAALVCRRWHRLFMPVLWGDPASHFGTENDAVYVALTRFRRTLKYARLEVRMLTHTLHLPPALSEIYGGPRPEWLREILESLPGLQSLVVSKLPFFDHNSMTALKTTSGPGGSESTSQTYNVRLLLADSEPNTTSQGIAETLLRFPDLIYLDLSYTTPARDRMVLSALSQLEHLQVLKLRGIGLKDSDAEFLANAIGRRVRFLDLRNNLLTDMSIRSLLQASFLPLGDSTSMHGPQRGTVEPLTNSPQSQSRPLFPDPKFFSSPVLDEQVMKALTQQLTGRAWVEDLPQVGITHLYIADNPISVEGAASLLASSLLHALDVGTVDTVESISRQQHPLASPQGNSQEFPGAEKLIPILGSAAKENLTYLRAHHALCTADGPLRGDTVLDALLPELPVGNENEVSREAELDATNQIHEVPANEAAIFELPGSPVPQSWSVGNGRKLTVYEDEPLPERRRGSVFAPEVVETVQVSEDGGQKSPYGATSSHLPRHVSISSISSIPNTTWDTAGSIPQCSSPISVDDSRSQKIQELLAKRPKGFPRRDGKAGNFSYLHPSHIPHLETLVLTDVPSHISANSPILKSLMRFITACSNEALLATLQAGSDYTLPPGQDRARAEQERARSLFALRRLVLEITPTVRSKRLTAWKPAGYRTGAAKSSTGDRDVENLWSAAVDDFSFFDEDECGIPNDYSGKYFPMAALNEKVTLIPDDDGPGQAGPSQPDITAASPNRLQPGQCISQTHAVRCTGASGIGEDVGIPRDEIPEMDLVAELASFRRAKKIEYEGLMRRTSGRRTSSRLSSSISSCQSPSVATLAASSAPPLSIAHFVEGHWKGEVKVIRNAAPKGRSGMVDMYGNYFEKGYLYP
ncbi:leucine rich repeat domain protein [Aspergillus heteromorphus CBS 117.55]|uniref:Leucine rich repeat domain protein n=1 Tax=Aspergillus heteromorphus CBS 117.55 TaxID=1448321 RepID=A0A317VTA0_9EURO|nr:leucine rich repeat domain protein [Aspergillus heteromorphus CBS 117.55]PWY76247.1 leucine rich repeat domain protein [Aspergillus heteromorphus CBS 117.55]